LVRLPERIPLAGNFTKFFLEVRFAGFSKPKQGILPAFGFAIKRILADLPAKNPRASSVNPIRRPAYRTSSLRKNLSDRDGILTVCPSAADFSIALGPPNPWMIFIAKETLGFRRTGFSPALQVTHANILSS